MPTRRSVCQEIAGHEQEIRSLAANSRRLCELAADGLSMRELQIVRGLVARDRKEAGWRRRQIATLSTTTTAVRP